MPRIVRTFTEEWRKQVAQRAQNESVAALSKELGIVPSVLFSWKKKYGPNGAGVATKGTTKKAGAETKVTPDSGRVRLGLRSKYKPEFRAATVLQLQKRPVEDVSKETGISKSVLFAWKRDALLRAGKPTAGKKKGRKPKVLSIVMGTDNAASIAPTALEPLPRARSANDFDHGRIIGVRTGIALAQIKDATDRLLSGTYGAFDSSTLSEYVRKMQHWLGALG